MTLSEEVRILGIDDFPHSRVSKGPVTVVCTLFRGSRLMDGVLSTTINYDGTGVTQKLTKLINSSKIKSQLHAIITDGVTFAGFNILDIKQLNSKTKVPVISVVRKKPNMSKINSAIKHLNDFENRIKMIENAGQVHEVQVTNHTLSKPKKIFFQCSGISIEEAKELIQLTSINGIVPEPIRISHLIGSGLFFGESKGRA
jgi:endonuclease V-like protein UPF0215 family